MTQHGADETETEAPDFPGYLVRQLPIVNRKGTACAGDREAGAMYRRLRLRSADSKGGETVGGASIMGILTLGAGSLNHHGRGEGRRGRSRARRITKLVANRFGEDE